MDSTTRSRDQPAAQSERTGDERRNSDVAQRNPQFVKTLDNLFGTSKPYIIATVKTVSSTLVGLLSAIMVLRQGFAAVYLMITVFVMLTCLARTLWSISCKEDMTLVHSPTVHKRDGTTTSHDPISVYEYDTQVALQLASKFSVYAVVTACFYLWIHKRYIILVYAGFIAYKIFAHPLFRIHVWQESHSPELDRPFGSTALFKQDESPVKVINGLSAFKSALRSAPSGTLVIVDFSATWCAPCRTMAPIFEALASEYQSCTFLSVDIDISQDVADAYNISAVPTFLVYRDSKRIELLRGANPVALRAAIQNNL